MFKCKYRKICGKYDETSKACHSRNRCVQCGTYKDLKWGKILNSNIKI